MLFDDEEFDPYDDEEIATSTETPERLNDPHQSTLMVGHSTIEQKLISLINKDAMPHAIIFSGHKGIGKSTMAFRLARALLARGIHDPNQDSLFGDAAPQSDLETLEIQSDHPAFSKVASRGHPDLLTVQLPVDAKTQKIKKEINVETARKVAPFLRMTSGEGGWRIVIIDDADLMNRNAQNAILKILEEPPKNALLILVCHRLGAMIPTIRSRCRVLDFDSLSHDDFNLLLAKEYGHNFTNDEKQILLKFSNQSAGQAKDIIDQKGLDVIKSTLELIGQFPNISEVETYALAESAGRAGQDYAFTMVEKTFLLGLEEIISSQVKGHGLSEPFVSTGFENIKRDYDLQKLLKLHEELKEHLAQAKYASLDKRLVILNAFNALKR